MPRNRDGGASELFDSPRGTIKCVVVRKPMEYKRIEVSTNVWIEGEWVSIGAVDWQPIGQTLVGVNVWLSGKRRGEKLLHVAARSGETRGQCKSRAAALAISRMTSTPFDPDVPIAILIDWLNEIGSPLEAIMRKRFKAT